MSYGTTTKDRELFINSVHWATVKPESCAHVGSDGRFRQGGARPPKSRARPGKAQQAVGKEETGN